MSFRVTFCTKEYTSWVRAASPAEQSDCLLIAWGEIKSHWICNLAVHNDLDVTDVCSEPRSLSSLNMSEPRENVGAEDADQRGSTRGEPSDTENSAQSNGAAGVCTTRIVPECTDMSHQTHNYTCLHCTQDHGVLHGGECCAHPGCAISSR